MARQIPLLLDEVRMRRVWAMLASYARSMLAAALAVGMTSDWSLDSMSKAAIAAIVPPLIRWINPNDPAFGRQAH